MKINYTLIFLLLIFSLPAFAKSIVYISNSNVGSCNNLPQLDRILCNRLISLGYDVILIWENNVRDNSGDWPKASSNADLIFIGNISSRMINLSLDQPAFCGNIMSTNKKIFSIFLSNYKNLSLRGCAFDILPIDYTSNNNTCIGIFYITKEGYLTYGYKLNDNISPYSQQEIAYIYGERDSNDGWVSTNCQPSGQSSGKYSVINTSEKGVFFGLSRPDLFTEEAWKLFDKAVLYTLNDWNWKYEIKTFPNFTNEIILSPKIPLIIISNITRNSYLIENETINITIYNSTSLTSYLTQAKNLKLFNISFNASDIYTLNLSGEGGDYSVKINVGKLNISIIQNYNYIPKRNFTLYINVLNNTNNYSVDIVKYKIYYSNFTEIIEDTISENINNYIYFKNITLEDWGDIYIAVYAKNSTTQEFGINYIKILRALPQNYTYISTNKNIYRPGENIIINITSNSIISSANLTKILDSLGYNWIVSPIPLTCSDNYCSLVWSTSKNYPQGNYIIKTNISIKNLIFELSSNFSIKAWDIKTSLIKNILNKNENISLYVQLYNVYDNSLKISMKAVLIDPSNKEILLDHLTISGDIEYLITRQINQSLSSGNYQLKLFINDSEGRNFSQNFSIRIYELTPIFIIPVEWKTVKNTKGIYNQTFEIINNHTEPITLNNIYLTGNISSLTTFNISNISIINPGKSFIFTVFVNITNEGNYTGNIIVNTSYILLSVPISIEYKKEILESYLETIPISLKIVTIPNRLEIREIQIKNNADFDANNLRYEADKNIILNIPQLIEAGQSIKINLTINTTEQFEEVKQYNIKIISSAGNTTFQLIIKILKNISSILDEREQKINSLIQNLSKISNKTAIEEINILLKEANTLINKAKESFQNENFDDTDTYISEINNILSKAELKYLDSLQIEVVSSKNIATLIYIIAFIIIVIIIIITIIKFKNQIKEFINKILKKQESKKQEIEEKQEKKEEVFIEPEQYRTEYY